MRSRIAAFIAIIALLAVSGCSLTKGVKADHPDGYPPRPSCSACHDDGRGALDHRAGFARAHGDAASTRRATCLLCHADSSCSACHANRAGMTPAERLRGEPGREAPHRGDWMTRHRIEGKINPLACAPCHARRDNGRCRECHR